MTPESLRRCGKRVEDGNVSTRSMSRAMAADPSSSAPFLLWGFPSSPREVFPSSLPPFRPPFVLESQLSDSQDLCAQISSHQATGPAVKRTSGTRARRPHETSGREGTALTAPPTLNHLPLSQLTRMPRLSTLPSAFMNCHVVPCGMRSEVLHEQQKQTKIRLQDNEMVPLARSSSRPNASDCPRPHRCFLGTRLAGG